MTTIRKKRNAFIAFFVGLYRVYVFDYLRGLLDLFRDQEQFNAMKDFFGMFVDHYCVQKRSVRKDVFGIFMMAAYGPNEQRHGAKTGLRIKNPEQEERLVENAYRAMQFSAAAYGWSILNHMASIFNLNFMPTAQPEWQSIATPKTATNTTDKWSKENNSPEGLLNKKDSSKQDSQLLSTSSLGEDVKDMEERMQANLSGETTIMSIVEGIGPEDIVYANFTSSDRTSGKLPNHFIVIDHEKRAVVLSFRGTFSLSEAITDVNCLPEEFEFGGEAGYAHLAMLNGARMAMTVLEEVLLAIVACYPEHRLWIVGHSLGAGVAALFSIILKEKHPMLPIEAWCFGCPSVLSLNLARKIPKYFAEKDKKSGLAFDPPLNFMQAFLAGDDNIPRLSHGSLLDLTSMADELWVFFSSKRDGLFSAIAYSLRSVTSSFDWAVSAAIVILCCSVITLFGYMAKVNHFMQNLFKWKRSLPECPEHLRGTQEFITTALNHYEEQEKEDGKRAFKRMPTLFKELAKSHRHSGRGYLSQTELDDQAEDMSPLTDDLSPVPRSNSRMAKRMGSFIDVVRRAKSVDVRDKIVRKAARKFLMAAHHDKLYPPACTYHIQFGASNISYSRDPLKYYGLEVSKPEYFGWLLFSVGMMIHHLPRSYLQALAVLDKSIKTRRRKAQSRWKEIKRKSRLASILSRLNLARYNLPNFTLEVVNKLERASDSVKEWYNSIEQVGQTESLHMPGEGEIKSAKKSVKDQFRARRAWKKARIKTSALQHLSKAEERLQKALQNLQQKQKSMEVLVEAERD